MISHDPGHAMRFNVEVKVSYRSREMPEDTALATAAVRAFVEMLPRDALHWCVADVRELATPAAGRWETVLSKAHRIAREAATVGWADPDAAEIEITIMPVGKMLLDDPKEWGAHFRSARRTTRS